MGKKLKVSAKQAKHAMEWPIAENIILIRIWDDADYWDIDTVNTPGPSRWLQFYQVDCVMPDKENKHVISRPYFLKIWSW